MYAIDIIKRVDEMRPNSISAEQKAVWLARCDAQIFNELIITHKNAIHMRPFCGEDEGDAECMEMMVDKPYDAIYEYYLMAQIDLTNGDNDHYNNSMTLYNDALGKFARLWNRENRPLRAPKFKV